MKLREKINALKTAQAEYHEKQQTNPTGPTVEDKAKFKQLRADISETITEGANPCPDCNNKPHGIFHDGTPNPFEIGCLSCRNHKVREALPEDAVEKWNKGEYLPPREPGTAIATHRDATGKTISEREVKLQTG